MSGKILFALLFVMPASARAFVCTRAVDSSGAEQGPALSWYTRDITYTLHADGTADVLGDGELDVLRASFDVWAGLVLPAGKAETCASWPDTVDLRFSESPSLSERTLVGYDYLHPDRNENLLRFYDTDWPHVEVGDAVIGLTTVTYNAVSGEILDADIEFNSDGFHFTIGDLNRDTDLMNTAVHEIGHFLGLAHVDDLDATMYAGAEPRETKKRDLACDDRNGIVFKYPAGQPNGYCPASAVTARCGECAPPGTVTRDVRISVEGKKDGRDEGGCRSTPGPALSAIAVLLVILAGRRRG